MAENEPTTTETSNRGLTARITLTVIIVAFAPLILVSMVLLHQFRSSCREKVLAHLRTLVRKHQQNIDSFITERQADISFLERAFSIDQLRDESFLQTQLLSLQQEHVGAFVDLGVIDSKGVQVAYAGPFKLGEARYADADWFQKAMHEQYFVSDVFLGLRGQPHFVVAFRENWRGESWMLRATINFATFNDLVGGIRLGETGFAFILNNKAEFQTKSRFEIDPQNEPYASLLRLSEKSNNDIHIVERRDSLGNNRLYVTTRLKAGDWLLIYQQDAAEAFADWNAAVATAVILLLLSGIAIVSGAYLLSRRMTSRVSKAEREMQIIHQQIVETGKLASVGELAAGIAHEINNPVAIMVEEAGWIEDLLEEEEFKESKQLDELKKALEQIRTQGKRCKAITHKLLSFARKTDSKIHSVQINDLIEELVSISAQRAKYSNVKIETNLQAGIPAIPASPTELQQVFLNLINNALDAMEVKGGALEIRSRTEGNYVVVEVADDGPGIPQANIARVFDPFFTTKPVGKGTGLGLSICYGIIKKMGGDIDVESELEVRTCFRVRLPITKKEEKTLQRG